MDYPYNVVVIVCVCTTAILLSLAVWFRVLITRHINRILKKDKKRFIGYPKSLQRALTQLSEVTESKGHRSECRDGDISECPICLASLYGSVENEAELDLATKRTSPNDSRSVIGASVSRQDTEVDLEAGVTRLDSTVTGTTASTITKEKTAHPRPQPIDDEILKLKRCLHSFHARCLASWFLRKRYDCPVCRTPYYQEVQAQDSREDVSVPPMLSMQAMPAMPFFW